MDRMTPSSSHPVPADALEAAEDARPFLVCVQENVCERAARLYLGNRVAADDPDLLFQHGVTSTLNLAVNIEMAPLALPDRTVVRRTHIGLIDGAGNVAPHILAAVFAIQGILGQASPGKPSYPPHRAGHLLVHCRGGRSRSVTVLALYLTLAHSDRYPSFDAAVEHLRELRGLSGDYPKAEMMKLGRVLGSSEAVRALFVGDAFL